MGIGESDNLDDGSYNIDSDTINNFISVVDSSRGVLYLQTLVDKINNYVELNIDKINRFHLSIPLMFQSANLLQGLAEVSIRKRKIMHEGHDFAPLGNYWNTNYVTEDIVKKVITQHMVIMLKLITEMELLQPMLILE